MISVLNIKKNIPAHAMLSMKMARKFRFGSLRIRKLAIRIVIPITSADNIEIHEFISLACPIASLRNKQG